MKCLKIEDNKGLFAVDGQTWMPIDQINKQHLLMLIDLALVDDFEMDEYTREKLANQAHQIIYKNIYEKLNELKLNKNKFRDESEALYKSAIEKYSQS